MDYELLSLLSDARLNRKSDARVLDYEMLYKLSSSHQVSALVFNQIFRFPEFDEGLKNFWKRDTFRINAMQTMKTDRFLKLYQKFLDNNLKVIVVKGIVCRNLYPLPDNRPSNDEDLYVEKQYFNQAKDILINNGLMVVEEGDDVTTFLDQTCGLSIELHTALFSKDSKAYGTFQRSFDDAFNSVITHNIMNTEVYSLDHDLHLLFLLMHFIKHFLHGGVGIRQILDIIMYSEAYGDKINWNKVYDILEKENVLTLILNVFALAHQKLDFDLNKIALPKNYNEKDYDYKDLLDDILDAGIFGKSSIERLHSSTITLNATSSGKTSILKSIFPSVSAISGRYHYLKKYPFLLPVAWVSRIFVYLTSKDEGNKQKTIEIGQQRVELLKKYKVIK